MMTTPQNKEYDWFIDFNYRGDVSLERRRKTDP